MTLILGAYFEDLGISGFSYICGERGLHDTGTWTSHAWLARGKFCVDVTADQFSDAPAAVIVEEPSIWHAGFEWSKPRESSFRVYSPLQWELARTYEHLKLILPATL